MNGIRRSKAPRKDGIGSRRSPQLEVDGDLKKKKAKELDEEGVG